MARIWDDEPLDEAHVISIRLVSYIRRRHAEARQRMLAGYPDNPKGGDTSPNN